MPGIDAPSSFADLPVFLGTGPFTMDGGKSAALMIGPRGWLQRKIRFEQVDRRVDDSDLR
jgi:hypothetical protein